VPSGISTAATIAPDALNLAGFVPAWSF